MASPFSYSSRTMKKLVVTSCAGRLAVSPAGVNTCVTRYCSSDLSGTGTGSATKKFLASEKKGPKIYGPYAPPVKPKLSSASVSAKKIVVKTSSGTEKEYPVLWLRDNCQCPACFNHSAMARSFLMENLDLSITASEAEVTQYGDLAVTWSDGHQSTYLADWLGERAFDTESRKLFRQKNYLPKVRWSSGHEVAKFPYERLMTDDEALLQWLVTLETEGVSLVQGTPGTPEATAKLCERTARLQYTHYGDFSHVKSKPMANNLAFTDMALNLHNDMPTYFHMPGLIFLHMIKTHHGKGGETVVSDGFQVAELMRQHHPKSFDLLTKTDVYFWDKGDTEQGVKIEAFNKVTYGPIIKLNSQGDVDSVKFNNQVRDSHLDLAADEIPEFYKALKIYFSLMYENSVNFKMQDGDMTVLDNIRCQHGRTGFEGDQSERHLVTTYMSWDEALCRRRRLQEQLNK